MKKKHEFCSFMESGASQYVFVLVNEMGWLLGYSEIVVERNSKKRVCVYVHIELIHVSTKDCKKNAIPIPLQPPFSGTGFERYNPPLLCSHVYTTSILKCAVNKSNQWVGFIFLELSFLYSQ